MNADNLAQFIGNSLAQYLGNSLAGFFNDFKGGDPFSPNSTQPGYEPRDPFENSRLDDLLPQNQPLTAADDMVMAFEEGRPSIFPPDLQNGVLPTESPSLMGLQAGRCLEQQYLLVFILDSGLCLAMNLRIQKAQRLF